MEPVATDACVGVVARDREPGCNGRQLFVKGGVKTSELGHFRPSCGQRLDQPNLQGQVGGIERDGLSQVGEHSLGDHLRVDALPASVD